jgi:argininosuccinate synthase (EC 6.3.4.5)
VAFVADIGQERSDLEGVEQKALQSGASECHVVDLREEFIRDYVYPVLQTGALYEGSYLLGTSMARPIIAKAQVERGVESGRRRAVPRCDRQRQRPGALRDHLHRAGAAAESGGAVA